MPKKSSSRKSLTATRTFDARPDTVDFRDKMYEPTLVEVPPAINLSDYKRNGVPILDQGQEGACTGFGLATVANYLLRCRRVKPDKVSVSPRMFYEMAKRYDEWPGEQYDGSSARGAIKGWYKHGVCAESVWPYDVGRPDANITDRRAADAIKRPLGAYYRVNHKDLVAMHAAIAEVGVLYATATVHEGWGEVDRNGLIPRREAIQGGHAFAIVAYDHRGFWIQNSWGTSWGMRGFALLTYDDWLTNGNDVWVARLAVPISLEKTATAMAVGPIVSAPTLAASFVDLRPHVVSIGNDGVLRQTGTYGTSEADVTEMFQHMIPSTMQSWKTKRILLYAHGGLVGEDVALQRVAEYRETLLAQQIYPIAFIWKTDYWTTIKNILADAVRQRRPEGFWDNAKDFMLDRLDDALEPLARTLTGKAVWDEMKENALLASTSANGGARFVIDQLASLMKADPKIEVHVLGHSAGSIFLAPIVQGLTAEGTIGSGPMKGEQGHNESVATCTLWAPACTMELFKEAYLPAIRSEAVEQFALFTMTDQAEQDDDCANIYHKSLLYLVSNAFEKRYRIPVLRPEGEAILGMQTFVDQDSAMKTLFRKPHAEWVTSPNAIPVGEKGASRAQSHGDFDDDEATLRATLARILDRKKVEAKVEIRRSARSMREFGRSLAAKTDGATVVAVA
ncbi:hypothetical protein YTPLAS18_31910 [Nitrospira sp.]|nr:hypothetical protein YTPLAS18_31910 [Nitrospira sp.]